PPHRCRQSSTARPSRAPAARSSTSRAARAHPNTKPAALRQHPEPPSARARSPCSSLLLGIFLPLLARQPSPERPAVRVAWLWLRDVIDSPDQKPHCNASIPTRHVNERRTRMLGGGWHAFTR